ncbi:HNH endonuclease [Silvanigrella aquatica]|uniref:HNH nuclease domain-containing protein n=1 Tax=Silvanigrella aquatica TaxID=1915309 RepID=A0A1L4CXV6_9BACT|nr:HNH endonuclease [Silvanigrella aquatica]APJ02779.1 hypothetical protein AXG55_02100 [Silvanigrella aquatica]
MKLINFLEFEPLVKNCHNMKAVIGEKFKSDLENKFSLNLNFLNKDSIDNLIILKNFDNIFKNDDNTLLFGKNKRVVLYIREFIKKDNYSYPKYHISECDIIKKFRYQNKSNRFVIHTKDDNNFHINEIENNIPKAIIVKLNVCTYCLKNINWNEKEFTLKKFFEKYPRNLVKNTPEFTSDTAALNYYSSYWNEISRKTKEANNFKCEECGIYLGAKESLNFLHVHHVNGDRSDNRTKNLQTLCYECHSNKPNHEHMKKDNQFVRFQKLKSSFF